MIISDLKKIFDFLQQIAHTHTKWIHEHSIRVFFLSFFFFCDLNFLIPKLTGNCIIAVYSVYSNKKKVEYKEIKANLEFNLTLFVWSVCYLASFILISTTEKKQPHTHWTSNLFKN